MERCLCNALRFGVALRRVQVFGRVLALIFRVNAVILCYYCSSSASS